MTIQRKYDFQSGTRISSQQVDDELNQLVGAVNTNESNITSNGSRLTAVESGKASKSPGTVFTATPQNGWTGTIQYRKNDLGQVRLYLDITSGTTTGLTVVGNLPVGFRPAKRVPISALGATAGSVIASAFYLHEDGNIRTTSGNGLAASTEYITEILFYEVSSLG